MKKKFFTKLGVLLVMALTCSFAHAQKTIKEIFSFEEVNLFNHGTQADCEVTYDAGAWEITYDYQNPPNDEGEPVGAWGYAGWDFREDAGGEGTVDLSDFSSITLTFIPKVSGQVEFTIKYLGTEEAKFSGGAANFFGKKMALTIPLDADYKNEVEYVYLKSQHAGSILLEDIDAALEGEFNLSFLGFHERWPSGAKYQDDYEAIEFGINKETGEPTTSAGGGIAWAYGDDGAYFEAYDYVQIDFTEPSKFDITLEIGYNVTKDATPKPGASVLIPEGSMFAALAFNKTSLEPYEYKKTVDGEETMVQGGGVRDIIISSTVSGLLYVTKASLKTGTAPVIPTKPQPDLKVLNILWEPKNPQPGDPITFSAVIQNIGGAATADNQKHGCTFAIWSDSEGKYNTVAWSDNHFASMAPGEIATLTQTGGPGGDNWQPWVYGSDDAYLVQVNMNDSKNLKESDYENNFLALDIVDITGENAINDISKTAGKVYVANGVLVVEGFASDAIVTVYNLLGQKITNTDNLSGIYLVEVLSNGITSNFKVSAK